MEDEKLQRIFGVQSLQDKERIYYDWPSLDKTLSILNPKIGRSVSLRFKQLKCCQLRDGLIASLYSKYPSWFMEIPYQEYELYSYGFRKKLDIAYEIWSSYLSRRYSFKSIGDNIILNLLTFGYAIGYDENRYPIGGTIKHFDHPGLKEDFNRDTRHKHPGLYIRIRYPITKNQLKNYIDSNWQEMSKISEYLRDSDIVEDLPSMRDLEIVELRDCFGMKFPKIVTEIITKYRIDNLDASVNEDSVKTAYHRTKKRLITLIPERKSWKIKGNK